MPAHKKPPVPMKSLPQQCQMAVQKVRDATGLDVRDAMFLIFLAVGVSKKDAYRNSRRTDAKAPACAVGGSNLAKRLAKLGWTAESIPFDASAGAVAEWTLATVMISEHSTGSERTKAAEVALRTLGRLRDDQQRINVFAHGDTLLNTLSGATKPIQLPGDAEAVHDLGSRGDPPILDAEPVPEDPPPDDPQPSRVDYSKSGPPAPPATPNIPPGMTWQQYLSLPVEERPGMETEPPTEEGDDKGDELVDLFAFEGDDE